MLKSRGLRKALSMLCVLCMLFSMIANHAIAFAADNEVTTEASTIETNSNTEANDVKPADEDSAETVVENAEPAVKEGYDNVEAITEALDPDGTKSEPQAAEKNEIVPTGVTGTTTNQVGSITYNTDPIKGKASQSGVTVTVTAPAGCFPEGSTVVMETASTEKNRVGFDITFLDASGAEVQPANGLDVSVAFFIGAKSSLLSEEGADTKISVYHKNDDGTLEQLKSVVSGNDSVQIEVAASRFSEYGVISETAVPDEQNKRTLAKRETRSASSTNLADFLVGVEIDAPTDEAGNYIINPNSAYEMTLSFRENENLQFDDEGVLVYNFPDGILIGDVAPTAFPITVVDENGTAIVYDNMFEVVDGQLRVRFNQNDPNFERLTVMPNVNFSISISSSFDQSAGEIVFNAGIVKDFVYEEKSDLTIDKNVVYDLDSDTAYYELQIRSEGVNENVVIEDRLTGTALVFNQDVVVESSVNGTLSAVPDYTAVDNGFRVTIPETVHGEILTLRYSATVDNTKITFNGTVEQTNNTARVSSDQVPDGKEARADFAGQAKFQRVSKTAAGDPVKLEEGLYEQTWTILVNQDHKVTVGGTYIYDWITQNSRPFMLFTGDGITVHVTLENGETETRAVSWNDLSLYTNSSGTYGWGYLAPETDGKASYEITCTTLINTSGALGDLTLVNGAQVYGSYDEGRVTIGQIGESVFQIQKDAIGTTSTESEWKITVTVPGSGLPDLRVVDDAPKLVYEGKDYIDNFIEDSFEVDGLLDGESWKLYIGSDGRSYSLAFYQNGTQNDADKGVSPTADGQPRDIVIRFRTAVNQDWLNLAADDGYATANLYRHRNYAAAWSGSYRTPTVEASVIPIRPNLVKYFAARSEAELDGVTYPVFQYSLALFGPQEDGIVIQDAFQTEYLKLYEAAGVQIYGGNDYHPTDGNGTVSAVNTPDGISITISDFPKRNDGSFYPYYLVYYSLIVKDQAALTALNAAAAASQTGIDLENTARWNHLVSSRTVNYTYFPYVDKELLSRPTAENGYVAEFEVVINKYAEDLDPTSDVLAIQDELSSNLRFIPDSLTITPANDSIVVQHDEDTNILTLTGVPDQTTFVIRYQARVLGSGNVTYSNTIKFGSFEKTVEETAVVDSSGGGTGSNPSITLVKRDAETLSNTLAGATFQLFYVENGSQIPVQDSSGRNVTFTTGDDGRVLIVGNLQNLGWTLWADRTYCLIETAAPTGFERNTEPTYFILTDYPSSQIEFDITGDQLSIQDERIKLSIPVTKRWVGPAGESVTVNLLSDGAVAAEATLNARNDWQYTFTNLPKYDSTDGHEIVYDMQEVPVPGYESGRSGNAETGFTFTNTITGKVSVPVTKRWIGHAAESVTVELLADGVKAAEAVLNQANGWQYTFTDLAQYNNGVEIVYTIQEIGIHGYTTEITGDQSGYTITNTNIETIEIPVTKQWVGPAGGSVTVNLLSDGAVAAEATLNARNDWQYTFTNLPKYDSTDGHEIVYDMQEVPVPGYESGRSGNAETGFTFTNTITGKVSVPVTKRWIGHAAESVTVELLADGVKAAEAVLNQANGWQYTFTDLAQYSSGVEIVYTIREVGIDGYSSRITGNMRDGFEITNTNTQTINIPVEKRWVGTAAKDVKIKLYADGVKIADTVLNQDNNWKHSFTGLPKYSSTDGHEIVYSITEDAVSGYTTSIKGDMHTGFVVTNTKTTTPPSSNTPKTGDDSHMLLYFITMVISGIGLIWICLMEKRKSRRQDF